MNLTYAAICEADTEALRVMLNEVQTERALTFAVPLNKRSHLYGGLSTWDYIAIAERVKLVMAENDIMERLGLRPKPRRARMEWQNRVSKFERVG